MQVVVHPECRWEVCQKADALGSTERIIDLIERAPEGSSFAVGTEIHLVNRLAKRFAPLGKRVITLDESGCLCTTMYRISPQHLAWTLENLLDGRVVNRPINPGLHRPRRPVSGPCSSCGRCLSSSAMSRPTTTAAWICRRHWENRCKVRGLADATPRVGFLS